MKKILSLLLLCFSILPAIAQSDVWNETVQNFIKEFDKTTDAISKEFKNLGIDATAKSGYNPVGNEIILDVRFQQEQLWNMFDKNAMDAAKAAMIQEYKTSYAQDPDFALFIKLMKDNKACFKVSYSFEKNGKVNSKDFTITPQEIM